MTLKSSKGTGGGAAAVRGINYQQRVTAWVAVRILAQDGASPPWGLPEDTTLERLRCETEQPVDDLLVDTPGAGHVFCQIKDRVYLSQAPNSEFGSVLDQFVRQFIDRRGYHTETRPRERLLDLQRDRLVLIAGPRSSKAIQVHLPAMLNRLRALGQGQPLNDAATNDEERRAFQAAVGHVKRSWQAAVGIDPSGDEIRQLLSLVYIQVLDADEGGDGEREAKNLLRDVVLRNPEQAGTAWAQLIALCASFAAGRSGADRLGLQQTLLDAGIDLQATWSYRGDIERLKRYSRLISEVLGHHAYIRVGPTRLKICRRSTEELRRVAESASIIVVSEPGAGKSGALHDFVEAIRSDERDFVFLAADRLAARSLGQLRKELNLDHELPEILENWPGTQPAFLVIDALDAARGGPAERMLLDLIRVVVERDDRWRVVAAIRKFDLRYSTELRKLFSGQPLTEFEDPEPAFKGIRHLSIPQLSPEELAQISSQSADLQTLIENAPNELHELLCVPFNLQLMAELLEAGVDPASLTPVRTQLELLDRYWLHRIIRSSGEDDAQENAREAVLRRICEEMVKARTLRVDRLRIVEPATSASLNDLLRAHVLVEWQPSPTAEPDRYDLTFSHHILFDYAVARLLLRGRHESLIRRLVDDPDLVVFVRPSLSLHFQHLWTADCDHQRFWDLVLRMMKVDEIPEIGKLVGASVAAQLAKDLSDLEPLCTSLESPDEAPRGAAEQALRHLVGSLLAVPLGGRPLVGPDAGPWCNLLEQLSRDLKTPVAYTVRSLLTTLCD
ncbi:MAG: hypothetical protein AB1563_12025, partial [Bacillota bacterium]